METNRALNCCGEIAKQARLIETVEDMYNQRIEEARKNVERLCIAKAKAEALNIHKYPYAELVNTLQIW